MPLIAWRRAPTIRVIPADKIYKTNRKIGTYIEGITFEIPVNIPVSFTGKIYIISACPEAKNGMKLPAGNSSETPVEVVPVG